MRLPRLKEAPMHKKHLGDSFDVVKRFWREQLAEIALLHAHPLFVEIDIRIEFTKLTEIPVIEFKEKPRFPFGLFFDPDTGIALPGDAIIMPRRSHATLPFIVDEFKRWQPKYAICYDQSKHRKHKKGWTVEQQRAEKQSYLRERKIASFYYVSHAPFLFMAKESPTLEHIRNHLISLGIPEKVRLQPIVS
jgi:hypothetical protein